MKKRKLEILLEGVKGYENPKSFLEQYFTPASIAADVLFFAYGLGDVDGKVIADLGAGTGIFSIGACVMGSRYVYAVEIDKEAVEILKTNSDKYGCLINVKNMDVKDFKERVDTVFQNPPFGAQNRHADIPFLEKAIEISKVVYTIHNSNTYEYLESFIEEKGGKITHKKMYSFPIPHLYDFHREEKVFRDVVLYRVVL